MRELRPSTVVTSDATRGGRPTAAGGHAIGIAIVEIVIDSAEMRVTADPARCSASTGQTLMGACQAASLPIVSACTHPCTHHHTLVRAAPASLKPEL